MDCQKAIHIIACGSGFTELTYETKHLRGRLFEEGDDNITYDYWEIRHGIWSDQSLLEFSESPVERS